MVNKHLKSTSIRKSSTKRQTIGAILRTMIRESGATVAAIAREAGIAQPVLYRFVSGERDLTLRTADKLVAYFGLELRGIKENCSSE